MEHWDPDARRDDEEEEEVTGVEMTAEVKIGHRRQVVGILVSFYFILTPPSHSLLGFFAFAKTGRVCVCIDFC